MEPQSPMMFLATLASQAVSRTASRAAVLTVKRPIRLSRVAGITSPMTASPARSTRSHIVPRSKASLLAKGACIVHFKKSRGQPSKQSVTDAINCIHGKCGLKTAPDAVIAKPVARPAVKPIASPAAKPLAKPEAKPLAKPLAKPALMEALMSVKAARLAMFTANAALIKAEQTLQKFDV